MKVIRPGATVQATLVGFDPERNRFPDADLDDPADAERPGVRALRTGEVQVHNDLGNLANPHSALAQLRSLWLLSWGNAAKVFRRPMRGRIMCRSC